VSRGKGEGGRGKGKVRSKKLEFLRKVDSEFWLTVIFKQ
jgi:hypothetical protein